MSYMCKFLKTNVIFLVYFYLWMLKFKCFKVFSLHLDLKTRNDAALNKR